MQRPKTGFWNRHTCLLGGSWVVISRVISPLIRAITAVTLLIAPLLTTHEPPSIAGARSREPLTPQENYGLTLAVMGRFEDALGALKKAEPPFGPSMESLQTRLGGIIYHILQTTYDTYLVNYIYIHYIYPCIEQLVCLYTGIYIHN